MESSWRDGWETKGKKRRREGRRKEAFVDDMYMRAQRTEACWCAVPATVASTIVGRWTASAPRDVDEPHRQRRARQNACTTVHN